MYVWRYVSLWLPHLQIASINFNHIFYNWLLGVLHRWRYPQEIVAILKWTDHYEAWLLGTLIALLINIGVLLICAIGLWISRFTMSMINLSVPVVFLMTSVYLPESAVFFTRKNKIELAQKSLQWSLNKENVEEELEEIRRIAAIENKCNKMTVVKMCKEIFKKQNRNAFRIMLILMGGLTLSGAGPLLAYQSFIYKEAGFEISTNISIIVTGVAVVLAGYVCIMVVRLIGKRRLLLIAAPICMLSIGSVALFFELQAGGYDVSQFKWLLTVFIIIFVLGYGIALNPMLMAYMGEIFDVEVKAIAAMISSLFYAIAVTIVIKFYQVRRRSRENRSCFQRRA